MLCAVHIFSKIDNQHDHDNYEEARNVQKMLFLSNCRFFYKIK